MQSAAGGGAGSSDIATVWRDFGFNQYNIQHRPFLRTLAGTNLM